MSDYYDPERQGDQDEMNRRRRSEKYRQEDAPAENRENQEEPIQWSRRAADGIFNNQDDAMRPVVRMARPEEYEDDDDRYDDEDDEYAPFPWKRLLLIVLAIALIAGVGVFLYKTFIRPAKPQPEAVSFQAASKDGLTDTRMTFSITTNQAVDGVMIVNEDGEEISAEIEQLTADKETNRVWRVLAMFDELLPPPSAEE